MVLTLFFHIFTTYLVTVILKIYITGGIFNEILIILFSAYWPDFSKVPDNVTSTFGLPYDYTSVMHYPRYAFSKNGKETIVAKVSYRTIIMFTILFEIV